MLLCLRTIRRERTDFKKVTGRHAWSHHSIEPAKLNTKPYGCFPDSEQDLIKRKPSVSTGNSCLARLLIIQPIVVHFASKARPGQAILHSCANEWRENFTYTTITFMRSITSSIMESKCYFSIKMWAIFRANISIDGAQPCCI